MSVLNPNKTHDLILGSIARNMHIHWIQQSLNRKVSYDIQQEILHKLGFEIIVKTSITIQESHMMDIATNHIGL